ncbi:protein FAR1-RELATED SEQUENCE 5-like [Mercurialis annua]|uniref:protein FAR1-RELATED SEQUENCE 5-like n=1 Tax=Mercurialis annua TaxID=3986 RepID=UPI0024AF10E2|nr:protein FAR1-RELATED SEQUENCE 5-like [Mercurialis annua]
MTSSEDIRVEELEKRLLNGFVNSEEEAYKLYCDYAHAMGFSVRKAKQYYFTGSRKIRSKKYVCWKEGVKDEKESNHGNASHERLNSRTDCSAMVWFTIDKDGVYRVTKFVKDHNHEMAKHDERHLLRSARSVSKASGGVLESMINARIPLVNAFEYMVDESGGRENIGFIKKDAYNYVHELRASKIEAGDCQSLLTYFKNKTNEDGFFYWDSQLDNEGRMANFFWRDSRSKIDFDYFGDVVSFDTTYRTNKYNLICAPFVGVNHHWQTIMFGCAFLSGETEITFEWLFKTFLESMGNKQPKTIFTNQDQAMSNAIKNAFPESRHRLCQWHIAKKTPTYLGALNSSRTFQNSFHRCMSECETEEEFEVTWWKMINEHDAQEHSWLKDYV